MRLLLKLVPSKSHPYVNDYHYHLQAAIYSLIREGGLPGVHEKKGYKFFCFSNIFPYGDFKEGTERKLLISSPDKELVESIEKAAKCMSDTKRHLTVGSLQFAIEAVSRPFRIKIQAETTVHSSTPIVMRIPKSRYDEYGIHDTDYNYVFWRETVPMSAFVKQLADNMEKKTSEFIHYTGTVGSNRDRQNGFSMPEITDYRFIKSIAKPITVRQEKQLVIGSSWDITFIVNDDNRRVLEICLESGFGEKNSMGFGFMNPVEDSGFI